MTRGDRVAFWIAALGIVIGFVLLMIVMIGDIR